MINQVLKDLFDQAFTLAHGCRLEFSSLHNKLPKNPRPGCTAFIRHMSKKEGGEYYTWTGMMWAPLAMLKRRVTFLYPLERLRSTKIKS